LIDSDRPPVRPHPPPVSIKAARPDVPIWAGLLLSARGDRTSDSPRTGAAVMRRKHRRRDERGLPSLRGVCDFAITILHQWGMLMRTRLLATAVFVLVSSAAFAHPGDAHGFVHGFAHPFGGFDHLLAMIAVGLFAWQLGGRALWLVPATFVTIMAVGGVLGIA